MLAAYSPALPPGASVHALSGAGAGVLAPVDYGDVCVNVDTTWFAAKGLAAPATLDDLTKAQYRSLFVTPGATTSSPGLAFLLATVGAYGKDGWPDYWRKLVANDTKITAGWTDAYSVDFTAGEGKGSRPGRAVVRVVSSVHHPRGRHHPDDRGAAGVDKASCGLSG